MAIDYNQPAGIQNPEIPASVLSDFNSAEGALIDGAERLALERAQDQPEAATALDPMVTVTKHRDGTIQTDVRGGNYLLFGNGVREVSSLFVTTRTDPRTHETRILATAQDISDGHMLLVDAYLGPQSKEGVPLCRVHEIERQGSDSPIASTLRGWRDTIVDIARRVMGYNHIETGDINNFLWGPDAVVLATRYVEQSTGIIAKEETARLKRGLAAFAGKLAMHKP